MPFSTRYKFFGISEWLAFDRSRTRFEEGKSARDYSTEREKEKKCETRMFVIGAIFTRVIVRVLKYSRHSVNIDTAIIANIVNTACDSGNF